MNNKKAIEILKSDIERQERFIKSSKRELQEETEGYKQTEIILCIEWRKGLIYGLETAIKLIK